MKAVPFLLFIISLFSGSCIFAQVAKDWRADPKWIEQKYGAWSGPGVDPAPGPMDKILLKDYAPISSLVTPVTLIPKAKYSAIDVHTHVVAHSPQEVTEWVKTMNEVGIETSVVLTCATGADFDRLVELYLKPYPHRFLLFCGMDTTGMDKPDYPARAVAELVRCYKKGARGVGEWTDKGLGYTVDSTLAPDKRLHPDDQRLDPFWEKCAELKIPVSIHISDHPSSWRALDVYQERTPDFQHFNQYGREGLSYEELLTVRNRMLAKHPKTTFILCHFANEGNDLGRLGKLLDTYPNLYLDISGRDYEIGRAPRAALKFFTKYTNRLLFGTDMGRVKSMYQAWWRLLESEDEFMSSRMWWRYYGLALPGPVLEQLYNGNARRLLNWEKL
jgi:predicted TIM-barrel fold metal-dependent hydrolase